MALLSEKHVLGTQEMANTLRTRPPVYDKSILSTAPVLKDLSGGWSDTQPICHENGSLATLAKVQSPVFHKILKRCVVYGRPRSQELQRLYEKGEINKKGTEQLEQADRRFNALQLTTKDN